MQPVTEGSFYGGFGLGYMFPESTDNAMPQAVIAIPDVDCAVVTGGADCALPCEATDALSGGAEPFGWVFFDGGVGQVYEVHGVWLGEIFGLNKSP